MEQRQITCVDTLAPSHLPHTCKAAGSAAELVVGNKRAKYRAVTDNYILVVFAVETMGSWCQKARSLILDIGAGEMLTYWILGALPYFINSAVIPNQQVRPFEDPPPSNEFFMFSSKQQEVETPQQDRFDAFQAAAVPAKFILVRNYPQSHAPFQEYSDTISGPRDRQLLFTGSSPIVNAIPVRLIEEQPVQNTFFYKLSSSERTGEEPSRKVILQDFSSVAEETRERLKTDGSLSNIESRYYTPRFSDGIDELSEKTSETSDNPYSVENYEVRNENDYRYPAEDNRSGLPDTSNEIIEERRPIEEIPIIIEIIPDTVIQEPRDPSEEYQQTSDQGVVVGGSNIAEQRFPVAVDVPQERFIQNTPFRSVDNTGTFSESNDDLPESVGSQNISPTIVNILPSVSMDSPKVSDENDPTLSNSKNHVPKNMDGSAENYPTENNFETKSFSAHSGIISVLPARNNSYHVGSERNRTNEVADLLEPLPERNIQKREALMDKEPGFTLTDAPRYFHKLLLRNKRTSSPAVDSVDENPSHWRPQNLPNAQFITKRGPVESTSDPLRTYSDRSNVNPSTNADIASYRSNEIPLSERDRSGYLEEPRRYEYPIRDSDNTYRPREGRLEDYDRRLAPRRIIYYANLPEVVRQGDPRDVYRSTTGTEYGRYDFGRSSSKFPRESRFDDPVVRSPSLGVARDDRYRDRYRPTSTPTSYTIIDAERVPARSPVRAPYPQRPYQDIDSQTRYNRIPAPYQPNQPGGTTYEQFRKPNSVPPRTIGNPAPEPYRDYNPHQPAHWSMQVGTSLTVKDDGRPYNSGRRFYVHSQEQQPYSPARYPRVEDDPRHRL
ncbi:uncharacterized protein [Anabrus simplex]|uniref:uncharacterized protein n=1 Tax=Anabrus simplex TaxID=316456 RepID=UPI0035A31446